MQKYVTLKKLERQDLTALKCQTPFLVPQGKNSVHANKVA